MILEKILGDTHVFLFWDSTENFTKRNWVLKGAVKHSKTMSGNCPTVPKCTDILVIFWRILPSHINIHLVVDD